MVVRQGTFTHRVVNAWNGLLGKVVAADRADKFKLELDRYLEVLEMDGYTGCFKKIDTTLSSCHFFVF